MLHDRGLLTGRASQHILRVMADEELGRIGTVGTRRTDESEAEGRASRSRRSQSTTTSCDHSPIAEDSVGEGLIVSVSESSEQDLSFEMDRLDVAAGQSGTSHSRSGNNPQRREETTSPSTQHERSEAVLDPEPSTAASEILEELGELSPSYVGKIIGKGGEMIRDLQARSGAKVDVDDKVPPGYPRIIKYRGTRAKIDFCKQLVEFLCQPGANEADMPLGEAMRETLVIPSSVVGKVIGQAGDVVRDLQIRSQARVQIDHVPRPGIDDDKRRVLITGTPDSVEKAKEMVQFLVANPDMDSMEALNILINDKIAGTPWGSGPPYLNLPNQGAGMQPVRQPFLGAASYHTYAQHAYAYPYVQGYGAPPYSHGMPYEYEEPVSEVMPVAREFMGIIIGSKGVTVHDLQRRSGTHIQCNQDAELGEECEVVIQGNHAGIEMAKEMIREIIEKGSKHSFAGGEGAADASFLNAYNVSYVQGFVPHHAFESQVRYPYPTAYQHGAPGQLYQPAPQSIRSAWQTLTTPDGQTYYFNSLTGHSQWNKPPDMP